MRNQQEGANAGMILLLALLDSEADAALLSDLFDKTYHRMKFTAVKLLHDESEAEDAVQDTFINCMRHIETVRDLAPDARPYYLLTAVKRNALNRLRDKKRLTGLTQEEMIEDTDASVEEKAIRTLTLEQVHDAFTQLPEDFKDVLRYKYLLDLSDREIAKLLGVGKASVRVYLMRARKAVLKICEGKDHEKA